MSRSVFGWSLPPGCSNADIERAMGGDIPPQCDECDLYNEELETCPYAGHEGYCHKLSLVTKCAKCGKPLCKVQGTFKQEEIAYGMVEALFCCSKACAEKIQEEVDKELEEMYGREKDEWC